MAESKKETKVEKKKEEKTIKKVFKVDYYIKDLFLNKFPETNLEKHKKNTILFNKKPLILIEGMSQLFQKAEAELLKMKIGEEKTLKFRPEDAYGERSSKNLQLVPFSAFKQHNLRPQIGLEIDADGQIGTIKSISGGRIMVDFNSPYAGHEVEYYFKLLEILKGEEKIKEVVEKFFHKKVKETTFDVKTKIATLTMAKEEGDKEQLKQIFKEVLSNFEEIKEVEIKF
jgi:peptidylprolyl isomerase